MRGLFSRPRIRPRRCGPLLSEYGVSALIFALALLFLVCLIAKGRF